MRDYYGMIGAILGTGGAAYCIIPIGDPLYENADRTTVTTVGAGAGSGLVFTYSEDRTAFDLPTTCHGRGHIPWVPFNATDEEADTPDAAHWSTAGVVSWGMWLNARTVNTSDYLFTKDNLAAEREWALLLVSGAVRILVYDNSASAYLLTDADAALRAGRRYHIVATFDGGAAASGLNIYVDGSVVASTDGSGGTFVDMEDKAATVELCMGGGGSFFDGEVAGSSSGPFFTHAELTAQQVRLLYLIGLDAQKDLPLLYQGRGLR